MITEKFKGLDKFFTEFDSFSLDFNNLLNIPHGIGLSLIKNAETSRKTYSIGGQNYLANQVDDGVYGGPKTKDDLTPELTLPSHRVISLNDAFLNLGGKGIANMIKTEIKVAKYLEEQIKTNYKDFLEVVVPSEISTVCFSLKSNDGEDLASLNNRNLKLVDLINKTKIFSLSTIELDGKIVIRVFVNNYQTKEKHIDDFLSELKKFISSDNYEIDKTKYDKKDISKNPKILTLLFNGWANESVDLLKNIEINETLLQVFKNNLPQVIHQALSKMQNIEYAREIGFLHYLYLISEVDRDYRKNLFNTYLNTIEKVNKKNNTLLSRLDNFKKNLTSVLDIESTTKIDEEKFIDIFSLDKLRNIGNVLYLLKFFKKLKQFNIDVDEIQDMLLSQNVFHHLLNTNPRFFGWIMGAGLPASMVGHIMGTILKLDPENEKVKQIEESVLNTCKDIFHFPKESAGVLTSGGSMANLIPLRSAVNNHKSKIENIGKPIRMYVSNQTHGSSEKAVGHIIGEKNVVRISTDKNCSMDIKALEDQIEKDIKDGFTPSVLVGSIGTTNTGAIDDLKELIRIKEKYGLWLHIDGAYGGPIIMTEEFKWLNDLFPHFDSFALDFHKLMNITYSVGLSLVRNAEASRKTFFGDLGPEGKQPVYRSLSVYIALKNLGKQGFIDMIEKEIEMAKYLEEKVKNECNDFLEILVERQISIVCFSLKEKDGESLDDLNNRNLKLMELVNKAGKVAFTSTMLTGKVVLRACVCNYQTREEHIDDLIGELQRFGKYFEEQKDGIKLE